MSLTSNCMSCHITRQRKWRIVQIFIIGYLCIQIYILIWIMYIPSLETHTQLNRFKIHRLQSDNDIISNNQKITPYNFNNCSYKNKNNVTILPAFCRNNQQYNQYKNHEYKLLSTFIRSLPYFNKSKYGNCNRFIIHLKHQLNKFENHNINVTQHIDLNSKPIECLNQTYIYKGYKQTINELSNISTQTDYDGLLFHLKYKRQIQILLRDLFTVFYEYNIIIHLFGATALSWYRNCDPITWHDHDIDIGIFQHHFNENIIKQIFMDVRLKYKYEFSVDFKHERTPLLNGLRMQFHISSAKVYNKFGITCIDVFIINPTYYVYFTQNEWYHSQFFWWFTPYNLEKISVYKGDKEIEFEAYIIGNDYIKTFLNECFGYDWNMLPWMIKKEQIYESHLYGDNNGVVGIRSPIVLNINNQLLLDINKIVDFCVLHNGIITTTQDAYTQ
eukprot:343093_1